ncbi:MAG TPA: hypothetical protein VI260_26645 [Blastocatellia bacterium]
MQKSLFIQLIDKAVNNGFNARRIRELDLNTHSADEVCARQTGFA